MRQQELAIRAALGGGPPADADEVAFSQYQAEHAARYLATHPPGLLGAVLWAQAKLCQEHAGLVAAIAQRAALEPRVTAADAARAAALAEEEAAAVEAAIEEAECREEERQLRLAQIEALSRAGSDNLVTHLEANGEALAAAGFAP